MNFCGEVKRDPGRNRLDFGAIPDNDTDSGFRKSTYYCNFYRQPRIEVCVLPNAVYS